MNYLLSKRHPSVRNPHSFLTFFTIVISFAVLNPLPVFAQGALEEIIVTAQRREQSLQEVPISIETVAGEEIVQQGFRDMDDLAEFSPSVLVNPNHLRNSITVRGFGASTADALTIEQSAPTFVDGVHFGRTNMIKLAFLDVERVEVLKGPQPVYFGQNAISGAFNITSKKPTPTWEGDLDIDIGNWNRRRADIGVGGPITENFGIRVAGRYDADDGYLVDAITRRPFPSYKNYGGRIISQWNPNEQFQLTTKFEYTKINKDAEGSMICLTGGVIDEFNGMPNFERSMWADPPIGQGWEEGDHLPLSTDCFKGNIGRAGDDPWFEPPNTILEEHRTLVVDMRDFGNQLFQSLYGENMTDGFEKIDPWNTYLDMQYELNNGILISSLSSYSRYHRKSNRDNSYAPIVINIQFRDEHFESYSQELRLTSPAQQEFAGIGLEWMLGGYYQETNHVGTQDALRANIRRSRRLNRFKEDARWASLFGTVTLNFLDDRASIDLGARLTDYKKVTEQRGWGATWILDDGTPDGFSFPWRTRITDESHPLNAATVIGINPLVPNLALGDGAMGGPYDDIVFPKSRDSGTELDPQVVLRYRPSTNHSVYAKFAQSFKAGGADTAIAFVNADSEEFEYEPEYATTWEIGSKGTFLENRMRYTVSAFKSKIKDLQIASTKPDELSGNLLFGNAGKQSAKGIEASLDYAVTDQLTLNVSAALLDSIMAEFVSSCTPAEFDNADSNDCISDAESIELFGDTSASGRIDRSGSRSANAPVWKFVGTLNYEMPVLDDYQVTYNAKGFISDGYLTAATSFSRVTSYDDHGDLNMQIGFGDRNDTWNVSFYGRSFFKHRETYHPEFVIEDEGWESNSLYPSSFFSYGVKFEYNYR